MAFHCYAYYLQEVTAEKEKDFLTVLSMIKNKDPKIYSKNVNFYHEDGMRILIFGFEMSRNANVI